MKQQEREALRFDWAATPDDVWQPSPFHVDGLHSDIAQSILNGINDAQRSNSPSQIGIALQGQRGAGKTHLLGWVRERVQSAGGYFFLVGLLNGNRFWESTVIAVFEGLTRTIDQQPSQLAVLLERLSHYIGSQESIRRQILGEMPLTRAALDNFISTLRRRESHIGRQCQDTARALVLCNSLDLEAQDIGQSFLMSMEEGQLGERKKWGIQQGVKQPMLIVRELSRLLALTGPSVIAIDQIDTLVAQSMQSLHGDEITPENEREVLLLEHIAGGLMDLREVTRRTLSIVACLPKQWPMVKGLPYKRSHHRIRKRRRRNASDR